MSNALKCIQWYIEAYRLTYHPEEERVAHAATWRDEWADWTSAPEEDQ